MDARVRISRPSSASEMSSSTDAEPNVPDAAVDPGVGFKRVRRARMSELRA
jgi:hypothetical protein